MDAAARFPQVEGVPKEGCACRFFQIESGTPVEYAVSVWGWLRVGENEDVRGFDAFFLNTGRGDVDDVAVRLYAPIEYPSKQR
jgi:hypothetical protein